MKEPTIILPTIDKSLDVLTHPVLDPLFWTPHLLGKASAWWTHTPFAFWIVAACRPGLLVELGTHNGVSYAAFCEAVARLKSATRCYAVDTWAGDEHAGHFDSQVYYELRDFHDKHFSSFSELLKSTFDDALPYFPEGSIDLLHIDGFHTYEAVKHDFETWLPKLSDKAVVLFHDTNVRSGNFGVFRFFAEQSQNYPSFEFLHGHGLGILAVGKHAPAAAMALCNLEPEQADAARTRFAHLGARWFVTTREQLGSAELNQRIHEANALRAPVEAELAQVAAARLAEAEARARAEGEVIALSHEVADKAAQLEAMSKQASDEGAKAAQAEAAARATSFAHEQASRRVAELRNVVAQLATDLNKAREDLKEAGEEITVQKRAVLARKDFANSLIERFTRLRIDPSLRVKAKMRKRLRLLAKRLAGRRVDLATVETVRFSPYFDRDWYLNTYPDVATSGVDPAEHYVAYGASEGRDPGPWFSGSEYTAHYADAAGFNPLLHYMLVGAREGRRAGLRGDDKAESLLPSLPNRAFSIFYVSGEADTPGHQYRVARYMEAARMNGVAAEWVRQDQLEAQLQLTSRHDVMILWRTQWSPVLEKAIGLMHAQGKKVVFDIDDLMIEPDLADTKVIDGIRSNAHPEEAVRELFASVRRAMLAADVCVASTQELAYHMRCAGKTTHVLLNGFDDQTFELSRRSATQWRSARPDNLVRIGYAGGSRTHQRDLGLAIEAIARLLRENELCRLVLFQTESGMRLVDVEEYPAMAGLEHRIEWRPFQTLETLPREIARFDINIAPLEFGNPFCEAKSELKFFEAALVDVPTIASPTGPFTRAMEHGVSGFLATTADDWYHYLSTLAGDHALRARIGSAAFLRAMASYGPLQRAAQFGRVLDQLQGEAQAARSFALDARIRSAPILRPSLMPLKVLFEHRADEGELAEVSVVIPLYNYEQFITEALESVRAQTLAVLDLVVVDDCSTDDSLNTVLAWVRQHATRFNRVVVAQHESNCGLGLTRNAGFHLADSCYVLPLDADNRLRAKCCEELRRAIRAERVAFVYPTIQHFGASSAMLGEAAYEPQRFVAGNYIDAMALVSKEAWAIVGGYNHVRHGWEDYDFWCRLAEQGQRGFREPQTLADYRVHAGSMIKAETTVPENYRRLIENFKAQHPWVSLIDEQLARKPPALQVRLSDDTVKSRLQTLLPILRCPKTGLKLAHDAERDALVTVDGWRTWPILQGRPILCEELGEPEVKPVDHVSNPLPPEALKLARSTKGWVLNLSGGGSQEKIENVVEVEYSLFRHTDVVADAHVLPFDDGVFDAAIVMNAFEHYREPQKVAAELLRVLKPGGRILVRTAFMQPLHERPWHFFNCTRYGLEQWFREFEAERVRVSENFSPNHAVSWLASECEQALRANVSDEAAERFRNSSTGELVDLWRDPSLRSTPLWTDFEKLPQSAQEVSAAGFEFLGRKPAIARVNS
ncbi:class I SAM-dependent methyltransferase [Variovorax sp. OV700]|uniref:class I SAM-dependent methyltransferase n=1 Tax=Variovorax sp. OV700 TaxID=1882826 RepID=UPI00087FB820|nr:class I SAM-dependent methyltransferase [Variovorax sp. OV700]SDJ28672.1 Glycosyltransferase involved in cell wall bisynthesis [Variovorax sp. OV700]